MKPQYTRSIEWICLIAKERDSKNSWKVEMEEITLLWITIKYFKVLRKKDMISCTIFSNLQNITFPPNTPHIQAVFNFHTFSPLTSLCGICFLFIQQNILFSCYYAISISLDSNLTYGPMTGYGNIFY